MCENGHSLVHVARCRRRRPVPLAPWPPSQGVPCRRPQATSGSAWPCMAQREAMQLNTRNRPFKSPTRCFHGSRRRRGEANVPCAFLTRWRALCVLLRAASPRDLVRGDIHGAQTGALPHERADGRIHGTPGQAIHRVERVFGVASTCSRTMSRRDRRAAALTESAGS
jgi:hypothetical protein